MPHVALHIVRTTKSPGLIVVSLDIQTVIGACAQIPNVRLQRDETQTDVRKIIPLTNGTDLKSLANHISTILANKEFTSECH